MPNAGITLKMSELSTDVSFLGILEAGSLRRFCQAWVLLPHISSWLLVAPLTVWIRGLHSVFFYVLVFSFYDSRHVGGQMTMVAAF